MNVHPNDRATPPIASDDIDIGEILADAVSRMAGEDQSDAGGLWTGLVALGLDRATISESAGGQGLAWSDLGPCLARWGALAGPAPLAEALAGGWLAEKAGFQLPDAPIVLTGSSPLPSDACRLDIQPCEDHDQLSLFTPDGVSKTKNLPAGTGRATLAVLLSAQVAGALEETLRLTAEHASVRRQFGRALSKFQSVQQLVALLGLEAAAARAAADFGLRRLADDPHLAASIAMGRAARAAGRGAACSHQVHGAIGVTEEYPLHRLSKAMWLWRDVAGSEFEWSAALGARYVTGQVSPPLWQTLVDDLSSTASRA